MADTWDGRPESPERGDTWHWVQHGNGRIVPCWWSCSYWQAAGGLGSNIYPAEAAKAWPRYLGPCHTPAEVAALQAAAFNRGAEVMREAAAVRVARLPASRYEGDPCQWIRALPIPEDKP